MPPNAPDRRNLTAGAEAPAKCGHGGPAFYRSRHGDCYRCYLQHRGISEPQELDEVLPWPESQRSRSRQQKPVAPPKSPHGTQLEAYERFLVYGLVLGPQILTFYPTLRRFRGEWFNCCLCGLAWTTALSILETRPDQTQSLAEDVAAAVSERGPASGTQIRRFLSELIDDLYAECVTLENFGIYARAVMLQSFRLAALPRQMETVLELCADLQREGEAFHG